MTTLSVVVLFGYGMLKQLVFGLAWGDRPMSNVALAIVGPAMILFVGGLTYLFFILKLITEVKNDGLYIRFFPLSQRKIAFSEIVSFQVRTYRPIKEYGGWGIKYGKSGMVYNVSGNRGVQLKLKNAKPVLIGSQMPEDLARALKASGKFSAEP